MGGVSSSILEEANDADERHVRLVAEGLESPVDSKPPKLTVSGPRTLDASNNPGLVAAPLLKSRTLVSVRAASCAIAALPKDWAAGVPLLRELLVPSNALTSLRGLEKATALVRLDVAHNQLTALSLGKLVSLQVLWAAHNQIGEVLMDGGRTFPRSLRDVDLAHNQLAACDLSECSALRTLDLSHNRLQQLGPLPAHAPLADLALSGNSGLSSLPGTLAAMCAPTLVKLRVAGCALPSLPSVVLRLTALQELDASSNRIEAVQPDVGNLKDLRALKLVNNRISKLPATLCDIPLLSRVLISGNPLDGPIEEAINKGLSSLLLFLRYTSSLG